MSVTIRVLAAAAAIAALAGCSHQQAAGPASTSPPTQSASTSPIPLSGSDGMQGMPPAGMPPHGGMMSGATADAGPEPSMNAHDPAVDKLLAAAKAADATAKSSRTDVALNNAAADAYYKVGYAMMMSPKLNRKVKYRGALELFRKALKLNPQQHEAAEWSQQIVAIYQSMGRPVPQ